MKWDQASSFAVRDASRSPPVASIQPALQDASRRRRVRALTISLLALDALASLRSRFAASSGLGPWFLARGSFTGESLVLRHARRAERRGELFAKLSKCRSLRVLFAIRSQRHAYDQLRNQLAPQHRPQCVGRRAISCPAVQRPDGKRQRRTLHRTSHANPAFARIDPDCAPFACRRHGTSLIQAAPGLHQSPCRAPRRVCPHDGRRPEPSLDFRLRPRRRSEQRHQ